MILFFAFFAGVLSVLAPCVLPILPVLLWGWLAKNDKSSPYIILISSLFFIFTFTLILKVWAGFLPISQGTFTIISAIIITSYGLILIWPQLRDKLKSLFPSRSSHLNTKKPDFEGTYSFEPLWDLYLHLVPLLMHSSSQQFSLLI